jgi:hypothetical protein
MSGLEKSSSFKPEARNMARAPERFAPWIKVLLRSFGLSSLTYVSPDTGSALKGSPNHLLQEIRNCKKKLGHHLIWMMARVSRNFAVKPPSPAFAADFDDLANSYNSGHDAKEHAHGSRGVLRRHGVAGHFCSVNTGRCGQHRFPPCKVTAWGRRVNQSN